MGHYPIKCIRCAHVSPNAMVLFDIKNAIGDIFTAPAQEASSSASKKVENTKKRSIWDDDDDVSDSDEDISSVVELKDYMTFPEIQQYCESHNLEPCTPHWQAVDVTPDFKDDNNSPLLIAVSFQKKAGAAKVRASRRFCPRCKCEFPTASGSMPTYNVTVMGTSASGKTVYLSALNWILSQNTRNLPYNSSLSSISGNRANADFVARSNQMFGQGVLPGTTQIVLTEPLVVQLTYRLADKLKKCLVSIADMRGEDFTAIYGDELTARGELFASADAFMVLISPLNMSYIHNRLPRNELENSNPSVHADFIANINQYILPFFDKGQINAPSVIMMSKSDVLMKHVDVLQIPRSNSVVSAEPSIKYTNTYFRNQDASTQTILRCDPNLKAFLANTFPQASYTSFSSFGTNIIVEEDENGNKVIRNPNSIKPIRVIDPMIYILIKLGFLPDFSLMEVGPQYESRNVSILNSWIQRCT